MPLSALHSNFYHEDGLVDKISNCFERNVYLASKIITSHHPRLYELFIGNLCYRLSYSPENMVLKFSPQENDYYPEVISIKTEFESRNNAAQAISGMEALLDADKLVLLRTVTPLLPFWNRYDKDYKVADWEAIVKGHVILIIWHDQDNLYYVEGKWNLHRENHRKFSGNEEVGVVKKTDMMKALDSLALVRSIQINTDLFNAYLNEQSGNYITGVIRSSVNRYKAFPNTDGFQPNTYYNRQAIEHLISLCSGRNCIFDEEQREKNENKLIFGLDQINRRRQLVQHYMITNQSGRSELIDALDKSIQAITIFKTTLLKNTLVKQDWAFDSKYINLLETLLRDEDSLFAEMEAYCSEREEGLL